MAGEPILIVDDNAVNLKLVRVLLAKEGYETRTANDANEALAVLETISPRLILMDLQLARHGRAPTHTPAQSRREQRPA